jgi:hypothetical protein
MSLSEMLIKILGIVLAFVGVLLILSAVGVTTFAAIEPAWLAVLVGLLLIGVGIWIIRGGNITL